MRHGTPERQHGDEQQHARDREKAVEQPHHDTVDASAEVAGDEPVRRAERHREHDRRAARPTSEMRAPDKHAAQHDRDCTDRCRTDAPSDGGVFFSRTMSGWIALRRDARTGR